MAFSSDLVIDRGIAKITLTGELDAQAATEFRTDVEQAANQRVRKLVLLMSGLGYMSSAGLRAIVYAKQKMGAQSDVFVVGANDGINETLQLTGFSSSVISLPTYDASVIEAGP
jgi:anti-sigma B factor antagonist